MPPVKPSPGPQRKNFWRLSRVSRAQPHLDEQAGIPPQVWILAGVIIVGVLSLSLCLLTAQKSPNTSATVTATALPALASPPAIATVFIIVSPAPTIAIPSSTDTPTLPTATVLPTITPTATRPANLTARYRVQPGDTLLSIADKYHITVTDILRANNKQTDVIRIGEELLIPLPTWRP